MYQNTARRSARRFAPSRPFVRSRSLPRSTLTHNPPPPVDPPSRQISKRASVPMSSKVDWQRVEEVYDEVVCRQLHFADIAERHLHELPFIVEVSRSLYGLCDDLTLTTGQKINVHFLKKTEIAKVTGKRGSVLTVPINTSLRFSPLYEDVKVYSYSSVKKLVSAKPPPLVVCVSQVGDPESHKSASNISAGDILILKDGKRRTFRTGHTCWFNTRTNQYIRLNERCAMSFTAMSERTKLSLPVLLKHIGLPQRCFVYAGETAQAAGKRLIRRYFEDGMCTLLCHQVETSLVASCVVGEMGKPRTLEIATDFSIPVRILNTRGQPQQNLIRQSCELFRSFQPEMIDTFICGETELARAKLDLRKFVSESNKMTGITLVHLECLKPPTSSHHDYDNLPYFENSKQEVIESSDIGK